MSKITANGFTFDHLRDLAVFLVDARRGHAIEFSNQPGAHAQEYDDLERFLRTLQPGYHLSVGFGDSEETMVHYKTPFDLPRCESRKREGKRSWRCSKGVEHRGDHSSGPGGGRRWR